jgi:competence ComEA-like helix-hairpin-helix protein
MVRPLREARSSTNNRESSALDGVTLIKQVASLLCLGLFLLACRGDIDAMAPSTGYDGPQEKKTVAEEEVDWSVFLPEGEGRTEVTLSCAGCHDLRQVIVQKKSRVAWRTSVQKMVSEYKAPVNKEDLQILVAYLSANFGDKNPIEQLPVNINRSSAGALARVPGVSASAARAIVESRAREGAFASVEDLLRVKDIDRATFDKIRRYLKAKD